MKSVRIPLLIATGLWLALSLLPTRSLAQGPQDSPDELTSGSVVMDIALLPDPNEKVHFDINWAPVVDVTAEDWVSLKSAQNNGASPIQFFDFGEDGSDEVSGEVATPVGDAIFQKYQSEALRKGVAIETYHQPHAAASGFRRFANGFKTFREHFTKPSRDEKFMGTIMAGYRGVTTSIVWFSSGGIGPAQALGLVVLQTGISILHTVYGRGIDKMLSKRFPTLEKDASMTSQFWRRQLYSAFWSELIKLAAIGANGAPAFNTLEGQLSVLYYLVTVGAGDALLSTARMKEFKDPALSQRISFMSFLILAPIQLLNFSGYDKVIGALIGLNHGVVADLGFYQLTLTTSLMIGAYAALITLVKKAPERLKKIAALPEYFGPKVRTLVTKMKTKLRYACDILFTRSGPDEFPSR